MPVISCEKSCSSLFAALLNGFLIPFEGKYASFLAKAISDGWFIRLLQSFPPVALVHGIFARRP